MTQTDYTVGLLGVTDRKAFFAELLGFYAPHEATLTTWGRIPPEVAERLASFLCHTTWARKYAFRQADWKLSPQSLPDLTEGLCRDNVLSSITWGLIKDDVPLGLCRSWDDITLDGSEWIAPSTLSPWLAELEGRGLITAFERLTD